MPCTCQFIDLPNDPDAKCQYCWREAVKERDSLRLQVSALKSESLQNHHSTLWAEKLLEEANRQVQEVRKLFQRWSLSELEDNAYAALMSELLGPAQKRIEEDLLNGPRFCNKCGIQVGKGEAAHPYACDGGRKS